MAATSEKMFQTTNLSEISICFYCQVLQMMGIQRRPALPMPRFPDSEIASLTSGLFRGQMVVLLQSLSYESLVSLGGWHLGDPCVGNLKLFSANKRNLCKKQENNCWWQKSGAENLKHGELWENNTPPEKPTVRPCKKLVGKQAFPFEMVLFFRWHSFIFRERNPNSCSLGLHISTSAHRISEPSKVPHASWKSSPFPTRISLSSLMFIKDVLIET